jgi:hypothetical protein
VGHAAPDLQAAQHDPVLVAVEPQVVAEVDRGEHDAEVAGDLAPQGGDAARQLGPLLQVDERQEAVAHLQLQGVEGQQVLAPVAGRLGLLDLGAGAGGGHLGSGWPSARVKVAGHRAEASNGARQEADNTSTPAEVWSTQALPKTWVPSCWPRLVPAARVTTMPAAVETSRAGIWVTRPSPTVRRV